MKSIQEIFENTLFRIPDYQRGYAWKETHLDDFWQDLENLRSDRFHYTGALTLERPSAEDTKRWKGDEWIINSGSFKPFYIVDGQQRITTVVILLNILIELMDEDDQYLYQSKDALVEKYIYKRNEKKKLQSFIFGYEIDDPSYEYLKTEIFKQESAGAHNQPQTVYTNNLQFADTFFRSRLAEWNSEQRERLFQKVTQQLKFDLKVIESDLDIFVVFETMNNRGKPLTTLEKLKNRLIYLTTLMRDCNEDEKNHLRSNINDVWKTSYEYLGKNKKNPLSDDTFLRQHFIVYHYFEKSKDFPNKQIFKEIYTVQNTVAEIPSINYQSVNKYITSLQKAAKQWYMINNPRQSLNAGLISEAEAYWIEKLLRLGLGSFASMTLSVFLVTSIAEERIEYMKAVESFIFLNLCCAGRKSTLGYSHFPYHASHLYYRNKEWTLEKVIANINLWTFGNEDAHGYFDNERFVSNIKDLFTNSRKAGYYSWNGLKYLLFEYEEHLQGKEPAKVRWKTPQSIEHIFPQDDADAAWKAVFIGFSAKQKRYLCNSLGNFVLLSSSKNSELSNKPFAFKKKHKNAEGSMSGYTNGSHSEIEVSQFREWDAAAIHKRGRRILKFLQERWNVSLTNKEINALLLADEQLEEKLKSL